jgi:hypothetical protein
MTTARDSALGAPRPASERSNGAAGPLFSAGERWGWEWRDVTKLYVPFPTPPPAVPSPPPRDAFAEDPRDPHRRLRRWRTMRWLWGLALLFGPVLIADAAEGGKITGGWNGAVWGMWVLGGFLIYWRGRALKAAAQASGEPGQAGWEREWARLSAEHDVAQRHWEEQARRHHAHEQRRLVDLPVWGAVRPQRRHRRIDVYGGVPSGRQAFVTTLGASLLGCGEKLFVLDLSEQDICSVLFRGAEEAGYATRATVLPGDMERFDMFDGIDAAAAKDIVVEALHADGEGGDRRERSIDDRILSQVCEVLAPHVTLERVVAGLRVILREQPPPAGGDGVLSAPEWSALADAFNDDYRSVINEALVALESQLSPLRSLGRLADGAGLAAHPQTDGGSGVGPQARAGEARVGAAGAHADDDGVARTRRIPRGGAPPGGFACEGVVVSREGTTLLGELLVDMLVQATIRRLRLASEGTARAVIVIGAERLRPRHLERLDQLAATLNTRIVYLFANLRPRIFEVAGSGEAVTAIMRMGNPDEAAKAAELIGKDEHFKLTQRTATVGSTDTANWGESWSVGESHAWSNWSRNTSQGGNVGGSHANMTQDAESVTLVDEYVLKPDALRKLPPTALVLLEFAPDVGRERCRVADCNPVLGTLPRVSLEPFAEPQPHLSASA